MKLFFVIFVLLLTAILQAGLAPFLKIFGNSPNLIFILILSLAVLTFYQPADKILITEKQLWISVILAGLSADLFSILPMGFLSLSFLGAIYSVSWFSGNVFGRLNFWTLLILVLIATLFYNLILIGLIRLIIGELTLGRPLFYSVFLEIVYNIILVWLIFYGIKKIFGQNRYTSRH
ncbi:MAG: hypothetical protein A3I88_00850 [Candidatus Portnoybacteria bacterium RIFCSPLOWO2_12_FULL_39_9]|uniref:Rod shape-determining protein MreD n=1 Tax=Candidatus Portnoybacteria bacterium RIFCSPHIGHO2_12_FULL_38_9 TaxID=1801997 RepID=A0A1G2FFC0_9BACT|nr:MAG: hypothetical protein A3H00_02260 [Candidatus Portnoybacteria bacterium RBG_13_40_8]OGZ35655.1 MAG: hypothetical protein A2646_01270 [Candidatus Portnoybacteria bacterium RIFCSPHIGHO2_02_FULL_39_12]OGZ36308.1 MAG: hypothetical protein A3J64_03100 [Candidatus Portnoybacteria bacterium RIFCSPHIGHO2_12_FULL_38_9]OGZ37856.1 MAG: hypothetical protein A3F21_00720 [Candidatus Portnoybacteria bacterium RIFCSPLOWO2_01_FULL_38_39]OGZ40772.1 MAG: hypothetical protein A3I88_00850 [Candidatus Portnoy